MSEELNEQDVKDSIVKFLSREGWGENLQPSDKWAHGVDIKVKRGGSYFYIECKKQNTGRHLDDANFVHSLGQIVTRMEDGCEAQNYYGLGLPEASAKIALRRLPWRVSKRLSLDVFAVAPSGDVTRYGWQDLKKEQESK